jgi:drug/metabolite transporter (DMT)-like permease
LFFILYNIAVGYTTAARASLALATLPLQTMAVGALHGVEPLTARKTLGVLIAILGVLQRWLLAFRALRVGAWRGELIITGAVLCIAFYNVLSRPLIQRSSALGLAAALAFILWVLAFQQITPTRVVSAMTVNPIAASLLAARLLGETNRREFNYRPGGGISGNLGCENRIRKVFLTWRRPLYFRHARRGRDIGRGGGSALCGVSLVFKKGRPWRGSAKFLSACATP